MAPVFEQSLPLCYALSAVGGILEVGSTAVLAVPDAREKEGIKLPWWLPKVALASNVTMQLLGSLASVRLLAISVLSALLPSHAQLLITN